MISAAPIATAEPIACLIADAYFGCLEREILNPAPPSHTGCIFCGHPRCPGRHGYSYRACWKTRGIDPPTAPLMEPF